MSKKREKTGLKDCFGIEMVEGDYVSLVEGGHNANLCGNGCGTVGKVVWDFRRKSWAVVTMCIPHEKIRPDSWGKPFGDWLLDCNSDNYRVFEHEKCDGEWIFRNFFSGGMYIPLTKKSDGAIYTPAQFQR